MDIQSVIQLNREIGFYFSDNEKDIKLSKELGVTVSKALQQYLDVIPPEAMAEFFDILARENNSSNNVNATTCTIASADPNRV